MDWLVDIHSIWRYAILVAGLGGLIFSFMAATGARPWDALTERLSAIFPIVMDVQLLIGLGVWFLTSWPRADTYLAWIHPGLMIVAIGLAHAGRALSERAGDSGAKGLRAAIFFGEVDEGPEDVDAQFHQTLGRMRHARNGSEANDLRHLSRRQSIKLPSRPQSQKAGLLSHPDS